MAIDDDFKRLALYTRAEAAELLHIPGHWLKEWVAAGAVPHLRKGARGVRFTYADIEDIGRLLPELLSPRRANSLAPRMGCDAQNVAESPAARPLVDEAQRERFRAPRPIR